MVRYIRMIVLALLLHPLCSYAQDFIYIDVDNILCCKDSVDLIGEFDYKHQDYLASIDYEVYAADSNFIYGQILESLPSYDSTDIIKFVIDYNLDFLYIFIIGKNRGCDIYKFDESLKLIWDIDTFAYDEYAIMSILTYEYAKRNYYCKMCTKADKRFTRCDDASNNILYSIKDIECFVECVFKYKCKRRHILEMYNYPDILVLLDPDIMVGI